MRVISFVLTEEQAEDVMEAIEFLREGVVAAPVGYVFSDGDALHAMAQMLFSGFSIQERSSAVNSRVQAKQQFCREFAERMASSGITIEDAAKAFSTAQGTITRWIYGHTAPAVYARQGILKSLETAALKKQCSDRGLKAPVDAELERLPEIKKPRSKQKRRKTTR